MRGCCLSSRQWSSGWNSEISENEVTAMRLLCAVILFHVSSATWAASGQSAAYPERPIRLIVGFTAGSNDDYQARIIAPKLTERLGQTVIVDNRAGAAGHMAAELAAHANPDGHTLMLA